MSGSKDRDITFDIVESIGVISSQKSGWKKELNLVSWNTSPVKFDIREWDSEHERMSRGITLTKSEMYKIMDLMKNYISPPENAVPLAEETSMFAPEESSARSAEQ